MLKTLLLLLCSTLVLAASEARIITLSPAINEIVFALGEGDKVVATTDYADYPEAVNRLPKVGGYFNISLEKIIALKPSIVMMQKNNIALVEKLKKFHIKTKLFEINSVGSIKMMIEEIGETLHVGQKAAQIIANIDRKLNRLKSKPKDKTVLFVFGASVDLSQKIFAAGKNLYFDELITLAGYKNGAAFTDTKPIGLEKVLAINPDIVIIADTRIRDGDISYLTDVWYKLPIKAAQNKKVFILNGHYITMPSDRIVHLIDDLQAVLE